MVQRTSRYGPFWACPRFGCEYLVGAHADGRPLGSPADQRTRRARHRAHEVFDQLWTRGSIPGPTAARRRRRAYRWLAKQLRLTPDTCHIGRFNEQLCRRVIELCRQRLERKGMVV